MLKLKLIVASSIMAALCTTGTFMGNNVIVSAKAPVIGSSEPQIVSDSNQQIMQEGSLSITSESNLQIASYTAKSDKPWSDNIKSKPSYRRAYIPILMYHLFMDEVPKDQYSIAVGTKRFEQQLKVLRDNGFETVTFFDIHRYLNGQGGLPNKPIIITTDDGYLSNYLIAYPLLKQYDFKATFFVNTDHVGVCPHHARFTWEDAIEMQNSGYIDIQSHGKTHPHFSKLTKEQIKLEIEESFRVIEEKMGIRETKVFAYPYHSYTKQTVAYIKNELNIVYQNTKIATKSSSGNRLENIMRIHVKHTTTGEDLIKEIDKLTR